MTEVGAIDAAKREIIYGEMDEKLMKELGLRYAKDHPKYKESKENKFDAMRQKFLQTKNISRERVFYSSSDSDSDSESNSESENNSNQISILTRRVRNFEISEPKIQKLNSSQLNLFKELCDIQVVKESLRELCISASEDNIAIILSVVNDLVRANRFNQDEKSKILTSLQNLKNK